MQNHELFGYPFFPIKSSTVKTLEHYSQRKITGENSSRDNQRCQTGLGEASRLALARLDRRLPYWTAAELLLLFVGWLCCSDALPLLFCGLDVGCDCAVTVAALVELTRECFSAGAVAARSVACCCCVG